MNDETFFGKRAITICRREFHIEQSEGRPTKKHQVFSAESLQNDVRPMHIVTKSVKMFGLHPLKFEQISYLIYLGFTVLCILVGAAWH